MCINHRKDMLERTLQAIHYLQADVVTTEQCLDFCSSMSNTYYVLLEWGVIR